MKKGVLLGVNNNTTMRKNLDLILYSLILLATIIMWLGVLITDNHA